MQMSLPSTPRSSRATGRAGAISKGCLGAVLVVGLLFLATGGCVVGKYNGIVQYDEAVAASFSEIDNQYKRRYDLVPQLVETVKGAADFERSTLEAVTEARASVGRVQITPEALAQPDKVQSFFQAQNGLSQALSRLFAVSEYHVRS